MIRYTAAPELKVRRSAAPQPPFWSSALVSPYGVRRSAPLSLDWNALRAIAVERGDSRITTDVTDALERERTPFAPPVTIDATGFVESVYTRGAQAAEWFAGRGIDCVLAISPDGALPEVALPKSVTTIVTWPPDLTRIQRMALEAERRSLFWGLLIPLLHPAATSLPFLSGCVSIAREHGARFVTATAIEADAAAKRAILSQETEENEEAWWQLFHSDLDTLSTGSERHLAALTAEAGLSDTLSMPEPQRDNWSAAVALSIRGHKIVKMKKDIDLGWTILRSASVVAALDKPIELIHRAAPLSIVPSIDELSAAALAEWLDTGRSAWFDEIDAHWRLRRDHNIA